MSKFMIVNLTWNSKKWEDVTHEKSNFKWVKEHPGKAPGESWNFYLPKHYKNKKGFFQVNQNKRPIRYEKGGIIFFFAKNTNDNSNLLVGFYANANYIGRTKYGNISAPTENCIRFYNYIKLNLSRHLPPKRQRMPQVGFTYITENNARNIISDALKSCSFVKGIEDDTDPKQSFRNLSRIAKLYFKDLDIPEYKEQHVNTVDLEEFTRKEFPNFTSEDRITITKDNKKLKLSYRHHQDLLNRVIEYITGKGYNRVKIKSCADLIAEKRKTIYIFEAKSITSNNLKSQIRTGISQLYEYSFDLLNRGYEKQKLILLLEKKPDDRLLTYCQYCEIEVWYKENKVIVKADRP